MELNRLHVVVKWNMKITNVSSQVATKCSLTGLVILDVLEVALTILLIHQIALPLGTVL